MPRAPYPLLPLEKVRNAAADAKAERLATARAEEARAKEQADAARREREAAEGAAAVVRDVERRALEEGGLRAGDLAQAGAWELEVQAEKRRLVEAEHAAARNVLDTARVSEERLRDLAVARGEAKVVERDRARWEKELAQREEKKAEEDAAEAWRPREKLP